MNSIQPHAQFFKFIKSSNGHFLWIWCIFRAHCNHKCNSFNVQEYKLKILFRCCNNLCTLIEKQSKRWLSSLYLQLAQLVMEHWYKGEKSRPQFSPVHFTCKCLLTTAALSYPSTIIICGAQGKGGRLRG